MATPTYRQLTPAQRAHLAQLIVEMKATEAAAQRFLGYLAAEHGVTIGVDGWLFDLENLCFVQDTPLAEMNRVTHAEYDPRLDRVNGGGG